MPRRIIHQQQDVHHNQQLNHGIPDLQSQGWLDDEEEDDEEDDLTIDEVNQQFYFNGQQTFQGQANNLGYGGINQYYEKMTGMDVGKMPMEMHQPGMMGQGGFMYVNDGYHGHNKHGQELDDDEDGGYDDEEDEDIQHQQPGCR